MAGFLRNLAQGVGQLFLPNTCWVCEQPLPLQSLSFCADCHRELTSDPFAACPRCGSTVGAYVDVEGGCTSCRGDEFHFDGVLRLGVYDGKLRDVILRLKQDTGENLAEAIAPLFAEHLAAALAGLAGRQPDVVAPIPLHWLRYWQRGFNQSEVLARALAQKLGKLCRPRLLRRVRRTPPQTSQTPAQRRENVRGAFALRRTLDLEGKTVLLVDDVLTTGATCSEAAKTLRPLRPAKIFACVLAKSKT
jgi:ComF family protein